MLERAFKIREISFTDFLKHFLVKVTVDVYAQHFAFVVFKKYMQVMIAPRESYMFNDFILKSYFPKLNIVQNISSNWYGRGNQVKFISSM